MFCRPGELRAAEWSEINFDDCIWEIPAERMKMKQPHIVPLSRQAIAILKELATPYRVPGQPFDLVGGCEVRALSSAGETRPPDYSLEGFGYQGTD